MQMPKPKPKSVINNDNPIPNSGLLIITAYSVPRKPPNTTPSKRKICHSFIR